MSEQTITPTEAAEQYGFLVRTEKGWTAGGECPCFSDDDILGLIHDGELVKDESMRSHIQVMPPHKEHQVVRFEERAKPSRTELISKAVRQYSEDEVKGLDAFNEILNKQPNEEQTDSVPVGGGQSAKYVPIEHSETFLDQVFQEWSVENLNFSVEMNEVVVSLEVVVRHPITHDWIRRAGIGAAPIQQEKVYDPEHPKADKKKMRPARVDEFYQTKRLNAMHSAMPAAKAFAFNNAVKSLGERFGRNLNRDNRGLYKSIFADLLEQQEESEEVKRAMKWIEQVGPEKAKESFSEEFLSNHPQVREKLESDVQSESQSGGQTDDPTEEQES